uniref:Uncharacterized protein n=1 Tax=Ditylenchus dipsaci TaxID=166011 RepID=A0A915EAX0_9BILA
MNIYLLHHEEFQRLYNCSKIRIDDFSLASRTHVGKSVFTLLLTSVLFTLYIPCTFALYKHTAHSCYKLMFYISISDMLMLLFIGFLHGYLGIIGSVYCTHPNFNYLCGICVNALWMSESSAEITLAINRCLVTVAPDIEKALFNGKRVYVWLTATTSDPEGVFTNHLHTVHNTGVAIVIPAIYIVFFVVLLFKAKSIGSNNDKNFSKKQKMSRFPNLYTETANFSSTVRPTTNSVT